MDTGFWSFYNQFAGGLPSLIGSAGLFAYDSMMGFVFPTDDINFSGPKLEELSPANSTYGRPIFEMWGRARIGTTVIWATDIIEEEVTETVDMGGGGGGMCGGEEGTTGEYTSYNYFAGFAVGICKGSIAGVSKIWANKKLIWDIESDEANELTWPGLGGYRFYLGDEVQEANTTMETVEGAGVIPGHRGMAYAVFTKFPLNDYGLRIPHLEFEVITTLTPIYPNVVTDMDCADGYRFTADRNYIIGYASPKYYRFNMHSLKIESDRTFPTIGVGYIPAYGCGHDIDERGYLYTAKYKQPNYCWFVYLDTESFRELFDSGLTPYDPNYVWGPMHAFVSRNPMVPWVVYTAVNRDYFYITHRDKFYGPLGGVAEYCYLRSNLGESRPKWACWDHDNGDFWMTWSEWAVPSSDSKTYISKHGGANPWGYEKEITDKIYHGAFCAYHPGSNQVVVRGSKGYLGTKVLLFLDADTLTENYTLEGDYMDSSYVESAWMNNVVGDHLYTKFSNKMYKINFYTYEIDGQWNLNLWGSYGTPWTMIYDVYHHASFTGRVGVDNETLDFLDRGTIEKELLSDIVTDICASVDITAGEIDVSDLTSVEVRGYTLNLRMQAQAALRPLMVAYFFDAVEGDNKIKFVKRGGSSVVTITEDDLACVLEEGTRPPVLVTTRQEENDIPKSIEVQYMQEDHNHQMGAQRASRQRSESSGVATVFIPVVLDQSEGKQIAEITLMMLWKGRYRYNFFLNPQYLYLEPTDLITLEVGSASLLMRIETMAYANGVIEIGAVADDPSVYVSDAVADGGEWTPPGIDHAGPMSMMVMDINMLRDIDNRAGLYYAGNGTGAAWTGGNIFRSDDEGINWALWASIFEGAVIGWVDEVVPDFPYSTWDYGSVTIRLQDEDHSLSTATEAEVLDGANACLLGDEIIQFCDVADNGDGTWTISKMLRGRRGTHYAGSEHVHGERFVLLTGAIGFSDLNIDDLDTDKKFRGVSFGMPFWSGTRKELTYGGATLMPYDPVHIKAVRDISYNMDISWIRRTRIGGRWRDDYGVPLGENTEEYELDIYYEDGVTLLRSINGLTTPAYTYSAADQATDGPWLFAGHDQGTSTSASTVWANDSAVAQMVVTKTRADVVGMKFRTRYSNATVIYKPCIYSDLNGEPDTLLYYDTEKTAVAAGWNTVLFNTPQTFTKGQVLWVGIHVGSQLIYLSLSASTGGKYRNSDDTYAGGAQDPYVVKSSYSYLMDIALITDSAAIGVPVKVYQISDLVGRGYPGEATV